MKMPKNTTSAIALAQVVTWTLLSLNRAHEVAFMPQAWAQALLLVIAAAWGGNENEPQSMGNKQQKRYLSTVDELSQRDIGFVSQNMNRLKIFLRSILELESQKVPIVWKRSATKLDSKSAGVIGCVGFQDLVSCANVTPGATHESLEFQDDL
jgi:hypothetical protein